MVLGERLMTTRNGSVRSVDLVVGHLLTDAGMGGAETYIALIANSHARRGRGSRIIVLSEPGPVSDHFDSGVRVEYLGYRRESIRNPFRFVGSVIRGYRLIAKAVKDQEIQVLQTHLPDTNMWGLALALTGRCKVVITIHNNKFLRGTEKKSFSNFMKLKAYRMMFRKCSAIVAVSGEVKKSLLSTLGVTGKDADAVVVVDNGVPVPEPLPEAAKAELRVKYCIGRDDFWIVAAGRLTEAKNFQCLVAAAAVLKRKGLPIRVLIGGVGHLRPDLERQITELGVSDLVNLPGNLHDLGDVMRAADLLAMPSRWEGLPMVLLEAMARRLPVVGTRINGLADTIEEGRHGYLVAVDDSEGLATGIERMIRRPEARRAMGRAGQELVREKFDFKRVYDDLCRVYEIAMSGE